MGVVQTRVTRESRNVVASKGSVDFRCNPGTVPFEPRPMQPPEPLPVSRLPKQTLHHVWSPKLQRTLVLTSVNQVRLWVMLEANPAVTTYCEHPVLASNQHDAHADFWLLQDGRPQYLALDHAI